MPLFHLPIAVPPKLGIACELTTPKRVFLPLTERTGVPESIWSEFLRGEFRSICHCAGTQYHFSNSIWSGMNSLCGNMQGITSARDTCRWIWIRVNSNSPLLAAGNSNLNHRSHKGLMVGLIRDTCPAFKRDQRVRPKIIISPCSLRAQATNGSGREK